MVHKAFQVLGKKVLLDIVHNGARIQPLGIFGESRDYDTLAEGDPRSAIDFIAPIYDREPILEDMARGIITRERIIQDNPLLFILFGLDHLQLQYQGKRDGAYIFHSSDELRHMLCTVVNDGNYETYDLYKEPLAKAGFKIR